MRISNPQWQLLRESRERLQAVTIPGLFAAEGNRALDRRIEAGGLLLDYSRHGLDSIAFERLFDLCRSSELGQGIQALVSGELLNRSEKRAALHTALRSQIGHVVCSTSG